MCDAPNNVETPERRTKQPGDLPLPLGRIVFNLQMGKTAANSRAQCLVCRLSDNTVMLPFFELYMDFFLCTLEMWGREMGL